MKTMGRVLGFARQPTVNLVLATLYPRKATVPIKSKSLRSAYLEVDAQLYRKAFIFNKQSMIVTHNHNDGERNRFKRSGLLHPSDSSFRPSPVVFTHGPDYGEGFGQLASDLFYLPSSGRLTDRCSE